MFFYDANPLVIPEFKIRASIVFHIKTIEYFQTKRFIGTRCMLPIIAELDML